MFFADAKSRLDATRGHKGSAGRIQPLLRNRLRTVEFSIRSAEMIGRTTGIACVNWQSAWKSFSDPERGRQDGLRNM